MVLEYKLVHQLKFLFLIGDNEKKKCAFSSTFFLMALIALTLVKILFRVNMC